jgi:hypothetical protein
MCALCGVLGGAGHWTEAAPRPGVFAGNADAVQRRRERAHRIAAASRILGHYGLTLSDWQASSYVLSTATGKTELVDTLGHLWPVAEKLLGRPCDPLDPDLIVRLQDG